MYIETKEIGPEGMVVDRDIAFKMPKPQAGEDEVEVGPVHLSGELQEEEDGVEFTGDISTVATLPCGRCLEPYGLPLDLHFDLRFTSDPETSEKGEHRMDEQSITEVRFDGDRIDLDALLAEQIYLGLPLKPLCRQDCRGLCPRCGTNLNLADCGCPPAERGDPRLAALKKLL